MAAGSGHFGRQGMRERAVRIEGKLILTSGSSGTTVNLQVPGGIAFLKSRATPFTRMRALFKQRGRAHALTSDTPGERRAR